MENLNQVRKFKMIVCCLMVAFVAAVVAATVSFVQIGNARRVQAGYNKQIEQLQKEKADLKNQIDYLSSEEYKEELAKENDKIPNGQIGIEIE